VKTHDLLPIDRLIAFYNLMMAAVWAGLVPRYPWAPLLFAAHFAGASLPLLLRRAPSRSSRPWAGFRQLYPLLWLSAFWAELDFLRHLRPEQVYDAPVRALEYAIFGVEVPAVWMPAMPQVWLSEVMHFAYALYYPLIFLPPLVLAVAGRSAVLRDVVFRLLVTYLGCFLVYMTFPVDGPHYLLRGYEGSLSDGFFYGLVRTLQGFGDSRGAAFPSSHVAGAVTIALLGWRWFRRPVAILLTLEAAGVFVSTVYTQNHYAVDALAGVAWALALQLVVVPALLVRLEPARRLRKVGPPLPVAPDLIGGAS